MPPEIEAKSLPDSLANENRTGGMDKPGPAFLLILFLFYLFTEIFEPSRPLRLQEDERLEFNLHPTDIFCRKISDCNNFLEAKITEFTGHVQ